MNLLSLFSVLTSAVLATGLSTDPDDITFYLYPNNVDPTDTDILDYDNINSISNTRYDSDKQLIMYTGGFTQNRSRAQPIIDAYLAENFADFANIIVVEWGALSGDEEEMPELSSYNLSIPMTGADWETVGDYQLYKDVVGNVPTVAERIKGFLLRLTSNHLLSNKDFKRTHLIGSDVGAHVMGLVGKEIQAIGRSIGRITGLDPTAPGFQDVDESERLTHEKARFVNVLYTNQGGAGYWGNLGHANTYINGDDKLFIQPSCRVGPQKFNPFCSHVLAINYYAKSITATDLQLTRCNLNMYTHDFCGDLPMYDPIPFGDKMPGTKSTRGMFYIQDLTP